jgi:hypothetical protein
VLAHACDSTCACCVMGSLRWVDGYIAFRAAPLLCLYPRTRHLRCVCVHSQATALCLCSFTSNCAS